MEKRWTGYKRVIGRGKYFFFQLWDGEYGIWDATCDSYIVSPGSLFFPDEIVGIFNRLTENNWTRK
jgi:hypothetical protein